MGGANFSTVAGRFCANPFGNWAPASMTKRRFHVPAFFERNTFVSRLLRVGGKKRGPAALRNPEGAGFIGGKGGCNREGANWKKNDGRKKTSQASFFSGLVSFPAAPSVATKKSDLCILNILCVWRLLDAAKVPGRSFVAEKKFWSHGFA